MDDEYQWTEPETVDLLANEKVIGSRYTQSQGVDFDEIWWSLCPCHSTRYIEDTSETSSGRGGKEVEKSTDCVERFADLHIGQTLEPEIV